MIDVRPTAGQALLVYVGTAVALGLLTWIGARGGMAMWLGPMMMIIPAWLLGDALLGNIDAGAKLIPLLAALPFLIVGVPLLRPRSNIVWPTLLFCTLLIFGSIIYFGMSWSYGVKWQGPAYTAIAALVNAAAAAICVWLSARAFRLRTYLLRYMAVLVPSVWLSWCAFPWLGETP